MTSSFSSHELELLHQDLTALIHQLPNMKHGKWIERALLVLVRLSEKEIDRLDWKILSASLEDMERGFEVFYPYRHVPKVTIFGSGRVLPDSPEYQMAVAFARKISEQGYLVITGGGAGIMQAGNEGAGAEKSFGLNIQLPYEQEANPFIEGNSKSVNFKYFFTRKLFFLRETDAIAIFPGGFGTMDEALECLTLCQTGRFKPLPLVFIDRPGGDYWQAWDAHIRQHLIQPGLANIGDTNLYTITNNLEVAVEAINSFYRVYHSSRYVADKFVIRLRSELSDASVEKLNSEFSDILVKGKIEKTRAFPQELGDETADLPRLVMDFNQQNWGRLYQLIAAINQ